LHLPSRVHYLTIDYTALSFTVPEKVRFRYKLEGLDPGWREVINDRKVQYSNPPPRHYRFRVIAANNSGVWNEQGDTLEFDIPPAWYQTLWFRALCAVALFLFLWWAYLLRVRHLRDQERKLRDVIETIPTFAWTTLPDGSVDFVNHHWKEFTGLSTARTVGSGWQEAVHPEDLKRHAEKWRGSITTGELFESEVRYRRAEDGQYRWFLARAVPLRDTRGKIMKWYGTSTDIEDRKRAELLRAELVHLNRITTMGELVASISHELKQPITASVVNAKTALRWLKRDPPNVNEASESTNKIVESSKLAVEIIDRLRSLYKKGLPKRESLVLNELIGDMIAMLRTEAARHRVAIRADLTGDVHTVSADRVQIQQVLMNLILNGIEAMKDAPGILTVKSELDQDGRASISIADTGVGLPADNADQIFEAFFTTKSNGSGMGLAISRSIIESHGGRLWATRNLGAGATFHFTLPTRAEAATMPATGT
jgi:PAS domain S-box-containing protein